MLLAGRNEKSVDRWKMLLLLNLHPVSVGLQRRDPRPGFVQSAQMLSLLDVWSGVNPVMPATAILLATVMTMGLATVMPWWLLLLVLPWLLLPRTQLCLRLSLDEVSSEI